MAGARVAAHLRQHGNHVVAETPRERRAAYPSREPLPSRAAVRVAVIVASPSATGVTRPVGIDRGDCRIRTRSTSRLRVQSSWCSSTVASAISCCRASRPGQVRPMRGRIDERLRGSQAAAASRTSRNSSPHANSSSIGSTPRSTSGMGRPCAPGSSTSTVDSQAVVNGRRDLGRRQRDDPSERRRSRRTRRPPVRP